MVLSLPNAATLNTFPHAVVTPHSAVSLLLQNCSCVTVLNSKYLICKISDMRLQRGCNPQVEKNCTVDFPLLAMAVKALSRESCWPSAVSQSIASSRPSPAGSARPACVRYSLCSAVRRQYSLENWSSFQMSGVHVPSLQSEVTAAAVGLCVSDACCPVTENKTGG